jgi:hypothetical protein
MTDLRFNKQDDPELERLIKIRNKIRNQYISDIKQGKESKVIHMTEEQFKKEYGKEYVQKEAEKVG